MMDDLKSLMARAPEKFNQLLEEIRAAGTDNLSFFGNGYGFEGGLSLQQNPFEFAAAIVFLGEHLGGEHDYLEIGSASGGACRFLVEHLRFSRAWVIDDHGHHRWPEQQANFDALGSFSLEFDVVPVVQKWVGDSHSMDAAMWLNKNLTETPALSFIDGDHTYGGCWADFEMVYALLKSKRGAGNLVMFHDTVACEGVKRSWQQAIQSGQLEPLAEYIGPHERPLGIGIGRVR